MFKSTVNKKIYDNQENSLFNDEFFDTVNSVFGQTFSGAVDSILNQSYPPHNILVSLDGNTTKIVLAVAGYSKENVSITIEDNFLVVSGKKQDETSKEPEAWRVIHNGISKKQFSIKYQINRAFDVSSAEMKEGILTITLDRTDKNKKDIPIS